MYYNAITQESTPINSANVNRIIHIIVLISLPTKLYFREEIKHTINNIAKGPPAI